MFGYVRPFRSELLVKEYDLYKAVYCELCRVLGKEYGPLARLTLSYDCTFYALLSLSVSGAETELCRKRCAANPLKRCSYLCASGESYRKAAALSVLLTCEKLRDDIADKGFFRSLGSRLLLPLASSMAKKAAKRYPFLAREARRATEAQALAERGREGPDGCAEPTAHLLAALFRELGGEDPAVSRPLERLGYFLGRWVYLMDAADDLERDMKEGSFNPFIPRLGLEGKRELTKEERKAADLACNQALNATAAQMTPALNLLPADRFGSVIENVIQKGLPEIQREILFLHVRRKREREPE